MHKKKFFAGTLIMCLAGFAGCVTAPVVMPTKPAGLPPELYHRVEKGQTLWRISKMYGVDLEKLVSVNKITDVTSIEVGQLIFIPARSKAPGPPQIKPAEEDFIWPLKGKVIATFGQTYNTILNKGINIGASQETEIRASRSGKVVFYSPEFVTFGKTIIIDHQDGFSTVYAGSWNALIKIGDYVQRGAPIATIKPNGRNQMNYLHFEIRKGYIPENPYFYLPRY